MYKVKYKSHNTSQAWASNGSYANEQTALNNASRISGKYLMVQVINPQGHVIWSS